MREFLLLLLFALQSASAHALSFEALEQQGFKCSQSTCVGHLTGYYPEEVALVFPASATEPGRYILHLVGNYEAGVNFGKDVLDHFHFEQLLAQSGRSEILIIPANRGPRFTHRDEFMCHYKTIQEQNLQGLALEQCQKAAEKRFDHFMAAVVSALLKAGLIKSPLIQSLALTGHSGAYAPMAAILKNPAFRPKIHEVYCLDCMYGEEDVFSDYARQSPTDRFLSVAIRDSRTDQGDFKIWSALTASDDKKRFETETRAEPRSFCDARWQVFASATPDHEATVTRYFPLFLKECAH